MHKAPKIDPKRQSASFKTASGWKCVVVSEWCIFLKKKKGLNPRNDGKDYINGLPVKPIVSLIWGGKPNYWITAQTTEHNEGI